MKASILSASLALCCLACLAICTEDVLTHYADVLNDDAGRIAYLGRTCGPYPKGADASRTGETPSAGCNAVLHQLRAKYGAMALSYCRFLGFDISDQNKGCLMAAYKQLEAHLWQLWDAGATKARS